MKTSSYLERPKTSKMAELTKSVSEESFSETVPETYSFTECQKIGKDFLDELKQSVRATTLPEIEEPCAKATKYLEKTEVLQLLEDLIAKLVFTRPEKPIDFLVNEMEELKRKGTHKASEDKAP